MPTSRCRTAVLLVAVTGCSTTPSTPRALATTDASDGPVASGRDASPADGPADATLDVPTSTSDSRAPGAADAPPSSDAAAEVGSDGPADAGADTSSTTGDAGQDGGAPDAAVAGYTLTWSDEFDGPDGSPPDPTKWVHDLGGGGWGNQELEYYTSSLGNAQQLGGNLVITATPSGAAPLGCWYGPCQYTSARLKTEGLFTQAYGRFEARAKMPTGKGLWPAFWMLGADIATVGWPACGEIDILETIGTDIGTNHGSLHAPGYDPTGTSSLGSGQSFADAFHTFAAEWDPGEVRFYVDDQLYETQVQGALDGGTWTFDQPFFLLLNVAVGGAWPGSPDTTTTFPQTLLVDWVRVYQRATPL
jgi:beta-glucanase (GH16 family)